MSAHADCTREGASLTDPCLGIYFNFGSTKMPRLRRCRLEPKLRDPDRAIGRVLSGAKNTHFLTKAGERKISLRLTLKCGPPRQNARQAETECQKNAGRRIFN